MADVSKTGQAPRIVTPELYRLRAYPSFGVASLWGLFALAAIATLLILVLKVSPSVVAILSEYTNPSYERIEAAYLLPPLVFLFLLSLAGFASFLAKLRPMLGFGLLSLSMATVLAVLVSDSNTDFTTEASKITIFTTSVLLFCGLISALNYLSWTYATKPARLSRIFWALLTFAFIFGAADEALMIHERLGRIASMLVSGDGRGAAESSGSLQDDITIIYALGAIAVISTAGIAMRASREKKHHISVFALAAFTYFASTMLDTADRVFHTPPLGMIDLPHMANTVEEILEFVAACLFLFGCLLAFLEASHNARLTRAIEDHVGLWRGRRLQIAVLAALAAFLAVAAVAALRSPPHGLDYNGTPDLAVQAFTGAKGASLHPDGMTSTNGAIYVVNDAPPLITVLDSASGHRTVVDVSHHARTPESIVVASDGRIFFTDDTANAVYVVDRQQNVTALLGRDDGLRSPKGLAIGPSGDLFVADIGASAIFRYSRGKLSIYASSLDGIAVPEELAFDSHGNLYVTEDQRRVRKVMPDRSSSVFLDESRGFTPEAIAIRNDRIYLTDSNRGAVLEYGLGGVGRTLITFPATLGRKLEGVAVADNGDVWVGIRPSHGIPGALLRIHRRAG